jgi:Reverse transcriptase (RNA-dependent DNA polymerase)
MAKKATTKTGATGTMGSTGVNDPTSGGGNDPFGGTEGVPDNPTGGKPTEQGGGTTPTGGGGTSGLSDTSFDDDVSVKKKPPRARIVDFIINTCGFPEDSTMVKVIDQQGWEELHSVVSMDIEKIKDFTVRNEHGLYEEKPLLVHLTFMKGFILLYRRRCKELSSVLDDHDTMNFISKDQFKHYMRSEMFQEDVAASKTTTPKPTPPYASSSAPMGDDLTALEFRRGVKRDKTHYEDLKDDKFFNTWNRGFVATAHMHHTHLILDEGYYPKTDNERAVFKEMQTFMYAVLEDHLKTDKGKSLVSHYESTRDAQSIYRELKKHALNSTAAQLSGDTLLQYITTARYPGNWRGTTYGFVLHWKEQIMKYEKLELEPFGDKQKLRMLQNAVGDVSELSYVKQLGDQDIARGRPPLTYNSYLELLLSACSTYDRKLGTPGKQKRAVYATVVDDFATDPYTGDGNGEYEVFQVDTDISDIMAYNTNTNRFGSNSNINDVKTKYLPREEWNKLSQAQKDALIEKRRKERFGNGNSSNRNAPRQANMHTFEETVNLDDLIDYTVMNHTTVSTDNKVDEKGDDLLAYMAGRTSSDAGDIRHVLAAKQSSEKTQNRKVHEADSTPSIIEIGDTTYYLNKGETITRHGHQYSAHMALFQYHVGKHSVIQADKALVDRGANGGIVGDDMIVLEGNERFVDVSGLDGHKVSQLRIVTAQTLIQTHKGDAIATFHQMALLGKGHSILSCIQMEDYGAEINDRSSLLPGGKQRILMDGYQIPLDIVSGLPYLRCRKPTDDELATLPHIIMTSDVPWDPSVHDHQFDGMEQFYDPSEDIIDNSPFDQYGEYRFRTVANHDIGQTHDHACFAIDQSPVKPDFQSLRPLFGWFPSETIKRTFAATTQFARGRVSDTLKQHWRSRFPACNVKRRNEPVATDTVFSDTPAVDCGVTAAQLFVGRESLVADVYGLKTDKEFVNTLEDNIRERGAMNKLISDCAKAEMSERVKQILRALCISSWYSEPYHQNQNFAENRYSTIKTATNRLMNLSGAPAYTWLLALMYVCLLLNHLASEALGWKTPLQVLNGQQPDISKFLHFSFFEPVYYHVYSNNFPSESNEEQGWWVGVATHVGDELTYKILTKNHKIIYRSAIRSALDPATRNQRLSPIGGETASNVRDETLFIRSKTEDNEPEGPMLLDDNPTVKRRRMVTIDPKDLIGRTFLKDAEEDGQRFRARVVRAIVEKEDDLKKGVEYMKFICEVPNATADEIFTYNEILDHIERDNSEIENDTEILYKFRHIAAHQGPLRPTDKEYKGSMYNVLVEWETGETTYEPLDMIASDDPVTCAEYAMKHNLLDTSGWKRFRRYAKNEKKLNRMINQAKLRSYRREPFWKFGVLVPRTHAQAVELDRLNGNTKWQDAEETEMRQLIEYQTFVDKGKGGEAPTGYKKIRCHMIYDVKHDGRHKARLVAGGHLTDPNTESVYSGVVSLRGIRLIVFLAELNSLELWGADVGNAYLEAKTKEKVYIVAGPEFGKLEGHTLLIDKALYGLRSSGLCWHQRFSDVLRDMGFVPSKAEADIWMREGDGVYEYIAVYVDDLLIAARDPKKIVETLQEKHRFKLKGVGPLTYHLGCDYFRDKNDGTLCYGPRKYIAKIVDQYEKMFGSKPKEYTSPLEKGDHPEVDTSDELDEEGIKKYQTMIGCLQWAISLGRFDIQTATMTMSRFRSAPRKGHLDRLKRIYGYLKKFSSAAIRIRTNEPDLNDLPDQDFDWCYSVYGNVQELLPRDAPKPLGKPVTTITYKDANLYHDMLTGRSVTGVLHLCNQTLIDWYSKRQATVETATFGSEFTAARIAVDQIIDLRTTLRYLGVPVHTKSFMFGDNQAVVTNSTIPHSSLNKRHNALAYHRVREMIAGKVLGYYWIDGKQNPADVVSKHWSYPQVWHLLKPILFYSGNTGDLIHRNDIEFNPDLHQVPQKASQEKQENTTSTHANVEKQE